MIRGLIYSQSLNPHPKRPVLTHGPLTPSFLNTVKERVFLVSLRSLPSFGSPSSVSLRTTTTTRDAEDPDYSLCASRLMGNFCTVRESFSNSKGVLLKGPERNRGLVNKGYESSSLSLVLFSPSRNTSFSLSSTLPHTHPLSLLLLLRDSLTYIVSSLPRRPSYVSLLLFTSRLSHPLPSHPCTVPPDLVRRPRHSIPTRPETPGCNEDDDPVV